MVKDNIKRGLHSKNFLALILALSGFILIFFSLQGVGISADSITYTSVSRNLSGKGTLYSFDGDAFVDFPIGYPVLLGVIQWLTTTDPFVYGLLLNSLLFGLVVFGVVRMLEEEGMAARERFLLGACVLASPAMLVVYEMLWSETLFIACLVYFLWALRRYGRAHGERAFWAMVVLAAVAAVTRYAGLTLIATGGVCILGDRGLRPWKRIKRSFIFGIASLSLLAANLIRNRIISGTVTGDRQKNLLPLAVHVRRFGAVLCQWLPPLHHFPALYGACATLFILGLAGACIYWWVKRKEPLSLPSLGITFCGIYTLFILSTAMLTAYEGLDTRLLSPLYIPGLIGIGGTLYRLAPNRYVLTGALCLLLALGVASEVHYLENPTIAYQRYVRYDIDDLRKSPTIQFINSHPDMLDTTNTMYSNAPDLIYLLSKRRHSEYLPELYSAEDIRDFWFDHGAYLVWLNACLAYPTSHLKALNDRVGLTLLYTFSDGAIYIHK
jgi:hypothetical protein